MMEPQFSLSPSLFAKAFPFHLVFDRELVIVQVGEVLQRVFSEPLLGTRLEQHFKINRPQIAIEFEVILKQAKALFLLQSLHHGMQLKGQMIWVEEQGVMIFLCSLWLTDIATLAPLGIKLRDFAPHDSITDFLFLLQTRNTALEDAKRLTDELTQKQTQLQKALQVQEHLTKAAEAQAQKLEQALEELHHTQAQLLQTEKMSSLGQLVAGVAHEINNPVNFIYGNLQYVNDYTQNLLGLVERYQQVYPQAVSTIDDYIETIDLDFLRGDLSKILESMSVGVDRICEIVLSLRNFSRLDEAEIKAVDIHQGIDSTLMILQSRLKANLSTIHIIKNYGDLPLVECYAGQLNQVFMNLLSNAIDALEAVSNSTVKKQPVCSSPSIWISTELCDHDRVVIRIADNGSGMSNAVKARLFDPFFTTKAIGKGTGLGLSISYQIVTERHHGTISCTSELGKGTEFCLDIPLIQPKATLEDSAFSSCEVE